MNDDRPLAPHHRARCALPRARRQRENETEPSTNTAGNSSPAGRVRADRDEVAVGTGFELGTGPQDRFLADQREGGDGTRETGVRCGGPQTAMPYSDRRMAGVARGRDREAAVLGRRGERGASVVRGLVRGVGERRRAD